MDHVEAARRVLDPLVIVQEFAGDVIIDLADAAAPFEARLKRPLGSAVERE